MDKECSLPGVCPGLPHQHGNRQIHLMLHFLVGNEQTVTFQVQGPLPLFPQEDGDTGIRNWRPPKLLRGLGLRLWARASPPGPTPLHLAVPAWGENLGRALYSLGNLFREKMCISEIRLCYFQSL